MSFTQKLLINFSKPLLRIKRRNHWLEKKLGLELEDHDLRAIEQALLFSNGINLGIYYQWYFQKLIISKTLKNINRNKILNLIKTLDNSDYSQLEHAARSCKGILLATPHHGHYILSIAAAVERLSKTKSVLIFYGEPATHKGNDIFDILCQSLWKTNRNIEFIHNNRRGLAKALQELSKGSVVIIMPDAFKNENDTLLIPFCGRQLNIALGTAVMARKTNSVILPMVSKPLMAGKAGFQSIFSEPFPSVNISHEENKLLSDYASTAKMFLEFEKSMAHSIIYWQYAREHFCKKAEFPKLSMAELEDAVEPFLNDPRIKMESIKFIDLDSISFI